MLRNRAELVLKEDKLSLVDIPRDVILQPIARGGELSLRDVVSLSNSCRTLHRFFEPTLLRIGAKKLLRAVINCDYPTIKRLVTSNPEIMFTFAEYFDFNGKEINMCPLAYSLRTRAWYALHIFKEALATDKQKENFTNWCVAYFPEAVCYDREAPLFSRDELEQAQPFLDLVSKWLNDENAVTIHDLLCFLYEKSISLSTPSCYSLQPGFWAYLALEGMFKAFTANTHPDVITNEKISEFINGVVNIALKHLFPREMLMQLLAVANADGKHRWAVDAEFNETTLPENCMFVRDCNHAVNGFIYIFQNGNPYELIDTEEPIWRGCAPEPCIGPLVKYNDEMILEVNSIRDDLHILRHLAHVREERCSMLCRPQVVNVVALVQSDDSAEEATSIDSIDDQVRDDDQPLRCTLL